MYVRRTLCAAKLFGLPHRPAFGLTRKGPRQNNRPGHIVNNETWHGLDMEGVTKITPWKFAHLVVDACIYAMQLAIDIVSRHDQTISRLHAQLWPFFGQPHLSGYEYLNFRLNAR